MVAPRVSKGTKALILSQTRQQGDLDYRAIRQIFFHQCEEIGGVNGF
jgi:hypothetical protein